MSTSSKHVVVVGAGHSGGKVVYNLRDLGFDGKITLIGDEPHHPYERPPLSKEILLGKMEIPALTLGPKEFWDDKSAYDRIYARVTSVNEGMRALTLDNGDVVEFDTLVLAAGGRARSLPGFDKPQVRVLRTIADGEQIKADLAPGKRLVVIGAGVIGMEVAASARKAGVEVTVVSDHPLIMARCLPAIASEWLAGLHKANGVNLRTGMAVNGLQDGTDGTAPVQVLTTNADGAEEVFPADFVLVSIGLDFKQPYMAGTGVNADFGIPVDAFCRVEGFPWVYATGDLAITPNPYTGTTMRLETWRNAENQARAIAEYITGQSDKPYAELPWMWSDQYDRNIQVVGVPSDKDDVIVRNALGDGAGCLLFVRNGAITGGVLVDSGRDRRFLEQLVTSGKTFERAELEDGSKRLKDLV